MRLFGKTGLADLTLALRKAEARLGREINITNPSVIEFTKKVMCKDHFLVTILRGPKEFVKGSQDVLDTLLGK